MENLLTGVNNIVPTESFKASIYPDKDSMNIHEFRMYKYLLGSNRGALSLLYEPQRLHSLYKISFIGDHGDLTLEIVKKYNFLLKYLIVPKEWSF
jgi:hypothetical protein